MLPSSVNDISQCYLQVKIFWPSRGLLVQQRKLHLHLEDGILCNTILKFLIGEQVRFLSIKMIY